MKILHIVHYDSYPRDEGTFIGRAQNGLERWLDSMILNSDDRYEHYVLYFNFYDASISVQRILKTGATAEYTNFFGVSYTKEEMLPVFKRILAWFAPQVVHIHYLQSYTKDLPALLAQCNFDQVMATMHDESFLGENFGMNQQYVYDAQVADFFSHLRKVVFLHDVSLGRYVNLYKDELPVDKVVKIPNGITLERVAYINEEARPFTVLFLGSFIPNKGSQVIAEFDALACAKGVPLNLYLLGRSLDEQLATTGITYMGSYNQCNIADKINLINPDVIVIASIVEEVFPYTAIETTALGYPIVAFNVGSLSTIEDEGRGFVVREKTASALLDKVEELAYIKANDRSGWQHILSTVKRFNVVSINEMVRAYETIYEEIGRRVEHAIDATAIFQQNLINFKQKEKHFYDAMQAYKGTQEQLEIALARQEEENEDEETEEELRGNKGIMVERGKEYIQKHGGFFKAVRALGRVIKRYGWKSVYHKARYLDQGFDYLRWIETHEHVYTALEVDDLLNTLTYQPKISILMPVYNVGEQYLRACIDSIRVQSYPNWELCIADDCSSAPHIKRVLEEYMQKDFRIKVVFRNENGHISAATNSALEVATGEFVAFIDNDDLIVQDAFLEVVKVLNAKPETDFIYSDEDKINAEGTKRIEPFFKPDWSPDTLWSHMYVTHLTVFRTSIAREIGGLRVGVEGSQDYDFVLRFVEKTDKIYHIPKVLYHWRMIETSAASGSENKSYAYDAAIRAKRDAVARRGLAAAIEPLPALIASNIVYEPRATDFVSIIIVSTSHEATSECLRTLYQKTMWQQFEVIVVTKDKTISAPNFSVYPNLTVIEVAAPFTYPRANNAGAKIAQGNLLLFLHDDIEVMAPKWLGRMIGQAIQPHTGVVGAKLLMKHNMVYHAGIIVDEARPKHAFEHLQTNELGYFGRALLNYNYIAVSGAAMMVKTSIFQAVGGFDEAFGDIYSDVAFCLQVYAAKFYNIIRSDVKLYHLTNEHQFNMHKDVMLTDEQKAQSLQLLREKMQKIMENDPFFNPNLTINGPHFSIKK